MNLENVLLRGTRAAQPVFSDVPKGTLYCVTDEDFIIEQSDGTAWNEYSPSASGGGGGWTLITNRSVGSGTSEDFTSGFGTYNDILIEVIGVILSGSAILQCRVSIDGGSNYLSSSGDYQLISTGGIASAQTSMIIASTSSTGPFFAVRIIAPFNSIVAKISQDGISTNNYYIPTANALNAIRIFPSGGQSFGGAGNIFIYGR